MSKTITEYNRQKHGISRIILREKFAESEFTTEEFRVEFNRFEHKWSFDVRTPYCGGRSRGHRFVAWSDRIARLLNHYCDKVGRVKWRVNFFKKKWGIF